MEGVDSGRHRAPVSHGRCPIGARQDERLCRAERSGGQYFCACRYRALRHAPAGTPQVSGRYRRARDNGGVSQDRAMNPTFMALSIGAMVIGVVVLFLAVTSLFALLRATEVTRVPVAAETPVTFNAPGAHVLHVEQPRLSFALGNAEFALRDATSAEEVRSSPVIFRTTVSGVSSARVSVRDFDVPRAGVY